MLAGEGSTRERPESPSTRPLAEADHQETRPILCEDRGRVIRPAAPNRRTTAAPHTAPSHRRGRPCVCACRPGQQTCSVARGAYAKGEAGARAAAVLQMIAVQAHAFGGVLLVVHSEPPLAQGEAARHLRATAARRRGRPLEGRRLKRVGRWRAVWRRRSSLGLRATLHPCAWQHLPHQQRERSGGSALAPGAQKGGKGRRRMRQAANRHTLGAEEAKVRARRLSEGEHTPQRAGVDGLVSSSRQKRTV